MLIDLFQYTSKISTESTRELKNFQLTKSYQDYKYQ